MNFLRSIFLFLIMAISAISLGQSTTFNYTGSVQIYTVPTGVFSVDVDVAGGQGGNYHSPPALGGNGGRVQATLAVTGGEILYVYIGQQGANGCPYCGYIPAGGTNSGGGANGGAGSEADGGGGGGGSSDIRTIPYTTGAYTSLNSRLVATGGGGGGAWYCGYENGGPGGGLTGGTGTECGAYNATTEGTPGTSTSGGAAGHSGTSTGTAGGFGFGGDAYYYFWGGGGGGGWYGAGGAWGGSGCGGSSYYGGTGVTAATTTSGYRSGDGYVVITINCSAGTITGPSSVCMGSTIALGDTVGGGAGTWTSSNTAIATDGATTGVVNGISAGTVTITYTITLGCGTVFTTSVITVNPLPAIISGPSALCIGSAYTYSDASPGGLWSTGGSSVSVGSSSGLVTGLSLGSSLLTYTLSTGCKTTSSVLVNPNPGAITGVASVCPGFSTSLSDPTAGGAWSSSNTAIATVGSSSGIVTGITGGTVTITYMLPTGCYATISYIVNPLPAPVMGASTVCVGQTNTLVDAGGGTWTSSNTAIATIGLSTGVATGIAAGAVTITYTLPTGCKTTFSLTVNPLPSAITGLNHVCAGSNITLSDSVAGGTWTSSDISVAYIDPGTGVITGTSSGTAIITYTIGSGCIATYLVTVNPLPSSISGSSSVCVGSTSPLYDIGGGTWSSSATSIATIDAVTGIITGISSGTSIISYTLSTGCATTFPMLVNPLPAAISGTSALCVGLTSTFTDVTFGGTWSSSNLSAATIVSSTGLLTGIGVGISTISYTLGTGCFATMSITINSSPAIITGINHVCAGALDTFTDATPGGLWSCSPSGIVVMGTGYGVVMGVAAGVGTITYSIGSGCSTTKPVTVNPLPATITGTPIVCAGSSVLLSDPTPGGTWSSSNISIATAGSTTGLINGIVTGTATILYTSSLGCSRSVVVTVNPLPAVISGPFTLCPGTSGLMTDATPGGTWSCVPTAFATISTTGTATGVAPGNATISYTLPSGCVRTKPVTVNPLPAPVTGPTNVCIGSSITLGGMSGATWSTSGINATVMAATGVVTGVAAGLAIITCTISTGCFVTATITVNPLPSSISGPSAVCAGSSITLSDPGSGTWVSSTSAVAIIGSSSGIVLGVATGTTTITYTLPTGCYTTTTVSVSTTPTPVSGSTSVCAGGTLPLSDAVIGGVWFSSNLSVATIGSLSGWVSGLAAGTSLITYSLGTGCTVTKSITVNPSPLAIAGGSSICIGGTVSLSDATPGGTWLCGPSTVAAISGTGILSGIGAGTATVDYTVAGCPATRAITVNLTPASITGPSTVCIGGSVTESDAVTGGLWSTAASSLTIGSSSGIITGISTGTAIITYSIGSCTTAKLISINPVPVISGPTGICTGTSSALSASITGGSWNSSLTSVATVGATTGVVAGIAPGNATIYYALLTGCLSSVAVTVNSAPSSITGISHVCVGASSPLYDGTGGGVWSIAPSGTASVGSVSGIVSGIAAGPTTVTYSLGSGCTVTMPFIVNPAPSAIAGLFQVCAGSSVTLSDVTSGGNWSSSSTSIATVAATTGVVSGITAGASAIYYTLPTGCMASAPITVNPLPAPLSGATSLCAGLTTAWTDATVGGTWSSSNTSVATIGSTTGLVTGVAPVGAFITYTLPTGCMISRPVTINSAPASIAGSSSICIGSSMTLTDATPSGTWSSGSVGIASVGPTGIVTGISLGNAAISYVVGGCPAIKLITVNALPAPISGSSGVCIGSSVTESDPSLGGAWSISNPAVATIVSGTGIMTGVASGTTVVSYSMGVGCTVTSPVTVNPLPAAISGLNHVCLGLTTVLSDATPGGNWSSSNTAIATISTTGLVTGVAAGTATISYTVATGCSATLLMSVLSVPPLTGVHNLCAWGDTMTVSNTNTTGVYTSSFATVTNLGAGMGRVLGNAPGTATVTYTLPSGCSASATFTVNPRPAAITGVTHICSGSTITLADVTPGGTWTSGNTAIATVGSTTGIVTGISGGSAYITYTLPVTGCYSDSALIVSAMPVAITGPSSVFIGTPVTLADAVPGGAWSSSNTAIAGVGVSSGLVSGVSVGVATITYTVGGICRVSKPITVMPMKVGHHVLSAQGTEESLDPNQVRIAPNPGDGDFTIDLLWDKTEPLNIVITDIAGAIVKVIATTPQPHVPLSVPVKLQVAPGIYLLTVSGIDSRYTARIVVNR